MINGEKILSELYDKEMKELYDSQLAKPEYVVYNGIYIKRLLLKTCKRYYRLILSKYFGDVLVKRITKKSPENIRGILKTDPSGTDGRSRWIDICGLLCDSSRIEALVRAVNAGGVASLENLHRVLGEIHSAYEADEWNWFLVQYKNAYGRDIATESGENLKSFIDEWKIASLKLVNMVRNDAEKEFDATASVGFGIDGEKAADFEAVRGTYEKNSFVEKLKKEIMYIEKKYAEVIKCV